MVGTARKDGDAGRGFGGPVLPLGQVGYAARDARGAVDQAHAGAGLRLQFGLQQREMGAGEDDDVHCRTAWLVAQPGDGAGDDRGVRSEEHTSELQSLMRISYAVFCLKKKKTNLMITCQNTTIVSSTK